jgi:translation initiation factor IF-3
VKVSIRFRGREIAHSDLGYALIKQIVDMVGSLGIVEQNSKMEGKALSLIFAPAGKPGTKKGAKPAGSGEDEGEKKAPATPGKQAESAVKS